MKLQIQIQDEKKITTYSADLSAVENAASVVVKNVESFLGKTFKKEVFEKKD
jgi:hypothetical protein